MTELRRPKGTYDILPPESDVWRRAHRVFDDLAERFGYPLVLTPMFEPTELFERGVGEATEVVEKQMYTFDDRGGRSITLRPEATASVVRAAIQAGLTQGIFKGAYWGPMFRYERPQQGRTRQFYQGGIEYLGSSSAEADVEVIEFGYRYLEELDVKDVEVRINSIGDAEDRVGYRAEITEFLHARSHLLSDDARARIDTNPMRVLDSKADIDVIKDAPVPIDHLGPAAADHFTDVRAGLEGLGIPHAIDNKLVRGLDYYNRTVWEYVPLGYGAAQNAVGGGGRYDGLIELLGGKPTPGVGLAMGVDRVILAADSHATGSRLDVFVVVADVDLRDEGRTLTSQLRRGGLRVDMTDDHGSVRSQFKAADRSGAFAAVVVGEEWSEGNVAIRDLVSGDQDEIAVKEIAPWVQSR